MPMYRSESASSMPSSSAPSSSAPSSSAPSSSRAPARSRAVRQARSMSSAETSNSGFEPAIPAPPWKSSSYASSSVGSEEPELGKRWCIFTPLVVLACFGALIAEFHENAAGVDFEAPPTDGCYWRLGIRSYSFCAASFSVNPLFGPVAPVLQRMGAVSGVLVRESKEYWRLVLGIFLHGGAVHCVANMVALIGVGRHLERYHGCARVGLIYLLSGVFGAVATATFAPQGLSVGASGAIFGLIGASLADILLNWSIYMSPCGSLIGLLLLVVLQAVLGTMPWLDNFAHVFGFVMGFVSSLAILERLSRGDGCLVSCGRRCLRLVAGAFALALLAAAVFLVFDLIEVDMKEVCPECSKISCRDFPWGCEENEAQDCWWTCNSLDGDSGHSPMTAAPAAPPQCTGSVSFMGDEANGRVELNCPRHTGSVELVVLEPFDVTGLTNDNVVHLCPSFCPAY